MKYVFRLFFLLLLAIGVFGFVTPKLLSARETAATMNVESVYGADKMKLLDAVQTMVQSEMAPIGIEVTKIYIVGEFRLPANVVAALNSKIEATQRAQQRENELREAEAQAKKRVAEADGEAASILALAKAQAQSNLILARSLTSELVEYKRVEKWDGKLPQFSGNATPMINFGK